MEDILKSMRESGFQPEIIEDDTGFNMITGKYVARIDSAGRVKGTSSKSGKDYDFRTIKLQIVDRIDGDKATNRYLDKIYNINDKGVKALMNDLFTAGIEIKATNDEELDNELPTLTDKTMNLRCWIWKERKDRDTGEPMPDLQMVKVVKEFKGKKKSDSIKSEVPF